jgi:PAS domain S-box-containing protein
MTIPPFSSTSHREKNDEKTDDDGPQRPETGHSPEEKGGKIQAKLEAALASMTDAVFICDEKGHFIDFNDAFASFHRFKNKEACARTFMEYPDILDVFMDTGEPAPVHMWAVPRALRGERATNAEYTLRRKDSGETWIGSYSFGPILDTQGKIVGSVVVARDITDRKQAEKNLKWNARRNELLSKTASRLLKSDNPQGIVEELCREVMDLIDCHAFFNFLTDPQKEKLHLNAYSGIPPEEARKIEWLDYGVAVCGCAALTHQRMICENIPNTPDPRTELVKTYGIKAYCCHPLIIQERLIGTLSFGARSRPSFSDAELDVMKSVSDLVAVAMNRIEMEASLRNSERQFRLLVESAPDAIFIQAEGRFAYLNHAALDLFGVADRERLVGKPVLEQFHPDCRDSVCERIRILREEKKAVPRIVEVCLRMDGSPVDVEASAVPFEYAGQAGALVFLRDITESVKAQNREKKLEEQLYQAQKIESIGRLAGGVAHDFNNMLSIIIGNAELALEKTDPATPLAADITEILKAAQRSAKITSQLLAFSRQQPISPKVVDLNDAMESMLKMIQRLIGEDIELAWLPEPELWQVKIDPSQIDQIMANLCVNARDAINGVGAITIETGNIQFDEAYVLSHEGFVPGEYVMIAVSDDGCGMTKETADKLFEPFFTTKEIGRGTGLGMATVYGIVKQNEGFINVYSEPGKGTAIRIYLRRYQGKIEEEHRDISPTLPESQGETLLLVEDDPSILKLVRKMLDSLGYKTLTASTPREAISVAGKHPETIHLLITDVVMPGMNGRELANELRSFFHPELKTLFMSGYTANVIVHRGVLQEGVHFIPKPFSKKELATKIRETLDNG